MGDRTISANLSAALWNVVYQARHLRRINDGDQDMTPETAESNLGAALDMLDAVLREEDPELEV